MAATDHRPYTQGDERDAQQLAHVERQIGLESLLYLLGKLDEEAEGEHQRQAETEIEPRAHTVLVLAVDEEDDGEEAGIGDGLTT